MIYVTGRDSDGYENTTEHADPLLAARMITAIKGCEGLHLAGVDADSKDELAAFREYAKGLKPGPVTW